MPKPHPRLGRRRPRHAHCAGTIFGRDVGPARIGVARGITQALIGKALDHWGRGTTEMLFQALQWAIGESVDVVSMSIGAARRFA